MKKRTLCIIGISASILLSACGGSSSDSKGAYDYGTEAFLANEGAASDDYSYDWDDYDIEEDYSYEAEYEESADAPAESIDLSEIATEPDVSEAKRTASEAADINQEKLVYTCDISIDTLDYEASLKLLRKLREKYDGFVESESFSDGGEVNIYSYYYVEDDEKHREYNATIRIPTSSYDAILSDMEDVGDIRSKNSYVENLTQSYTDLKVTLDVLQQTYDRYAALMENATDEEYILNIQEKLTDTQIQIAQVKSRMNTINQDVAYSTINIHLKEVKEYKEAPAPRDTFGQRFKETVSESFETFLSFLEGFLFVIIRLLPFVVLAAVIAVIVIFINRKFNLSARHKAKKQMRSEENARRAAEYQAKLKANREAKQAEEEKKDK